MKNSDSTTGLPSPDVEHWSVPKTLWVAVAGKPAEVDSLLKKVTPQNWQKSEDDRRLATLAAEYKR